ncbi:hypothetical protein SLS62_009719 [Diatrype stigma]|uniref:Uncharacterized protein n=1 Tax=Diatrype stigma TaxID=117547 RepID=A0AAN9UDJ6_9PEZI
MDVMLIGLMSLQNQIVFTQSHPVAYLVKLNIEMTMASLITKVARVTGVGDEGNKVANESSGTRSRHDGLRTIHDKDNDVAMKSFHAAAVGPSRFDEDHEDGTAKSRGIQRTVDIRVESASTLEADFDVEKGSPFGDEISLAHHPGHPRGGNN